MYDKYPSEYPTLFKEVAEDQEAPFRDWARKNFKPGQKINPVWHPIVQDECRKIKDEYHKELVDLDDGR